MTWFIITGGVSLFMQRFSLYPHYNEHMSLLAISSVLGTGTALAVLLFRQAIEFADVFFTNVIGVNGLIGQALGSVGVNPELGLLFSLSLAGFLVGMIMHYIVGHEKYHGVAAIMESVALSGGRLRYRLVPFKVLASVLSLGAGASLGPEDPSVQIGSNLGSWLGQRLSWTDERRKLLVAAGAASAIAAAFNAPIAGVFFALEVILGEFSTTAFGAVVLSAVLSSAVTQSLAGGNPVFGNLDYTLGHPIQLPFYVVLGILLAIMSMITIRFIDWQINLWHNHVKIWLPLEMAFVGAGIGIVGFFLPEILGPGEEFMHEVLSGHLETTIAMLLLIGIMKLVMTAISQGAGFVGGVFAPTLFIGIVLGSAYGRFLNQIIPVLDIGNPQAYAIAGMAGMLAGVVRAPMTAILIVFELTDDYTLILPIMLTAVICTLIIEQTGPPGIYMWSLVKQGLHLQQGRDIDLMQGISVSDAMVTPPPTISAQATMAELRHEFHEQDTRAFCVVNDKDELVGIVTLGDLQDKYDEIMEHENAQIETQIITVDSLCTHYVITVASDDVLWSAIRLMGANNIGRIPVVDHENHPIGILRRHDIMSAYNTAVVRKFHDQHYAGQIRLNALTGAQVIEYKVHDNSPVRNKHIRDIALPNDALIASIARRGKLIIPHGDTMLIEHDRVTIVTDPSAEPTLEKLFC